MDLLLYSLFVFVFIFAILFISTQYLNIFDKIYMSLLMLILITGVVSLYYKNEYILYYIHILYGVFLILGSLFLQNKYICSFLIAVMFIAVIIVSIIGDCPFNFVSKNIKLFDQYIQEVLYTTCILILCIRYFFNLNLKIKTVS